MVLNRRFPNKGHDFPELRQMQKKETLTAALIFLFSFVFLGRWVGGYGGGGAKGDAAKNI